MGSEWPILSLIEIAGVIDSRHKTPAYSDSGLPMVRVVDIKEGALDLSNTKKVSSDTYTDFSKGRDPEIGDLVISRVGSYGNVSYVYSADRFCLGQNTALITPKQDSGFLYYQLISPAVQQQIQLMAVGAVQKTISLKSIKQLSISVPILSEQTRISGVLGALDDKIQLNRQVNTTLETMAQALFKSWFVDFDPVIDKALAAGNPIPEPLQARAEARKALGDQRKPLPAAIQHQFSDRFVLTEEMGWVPAGWEPVSLDEIIDLIGGGTPKTSVEDYWGGDIPWFSVVDAPSPSDVFVSRTEKYISQLGLENSSTKLLPEGTTIISARGTVGKCALAGQPMAINQSCYGVRGKTGIADYFVYYTILLRVSELQQRGHGSVFNTITRDTFKSIVTPRSPSGLSIAFHDVIAPYFSRILENNQQSDSLARMRDTLLPKLLSGELRVPDAEAQLAEVM